MLFLCWASVEDSGPTLKQHQVKASCLLGTYHLLYTVALNSNAVYFNKTHCIIMSLFFVYMLSCMYVAQKHSANHLRCIEQ